MGPRKLDDRSGNTLRILVMHHVPYARQRYNLRAAKHPVHILIAELRAAPLLIVRLVARDEQHRDLKTRPAGFRFVTAVQNRIGETVLRVERQTYPVL